MELNNPTANIDHKATNPDVDIEMITKAIAPPANRLNIF